MGTWAFLKIDMATWAFLKIDMGHGDPPIIKGPLLNWSFSNHAGVSYTILSKL